MTSEEKRLLEEHLKRLDYLSEKLKYQVGELRQENDQMREFYRAALISHERLLKVTSRQLLEKEIHQMILEEEERQTLTKKHVKQHAWGGVKKEILTRD